MPSSKPPSRRAHDSPDPDLEGIPAALGEALAGPPAASMMAWEVHRPGPVANRPLRLVQRHVPSPGPGQVLLAVSACGVCRTDLHLAEGDLAPRRPGVVPGHEAVGWVAALGAGCRRLSEGQRVGVAWLAGTDGTCRFCRSGRENLCLAPRFTGWDRDGGYAEYLVADEDFAYPLPAAGSDIELAPLLCAGIIGYRALRRCRLPPGGRLGLYGFGASAHLCAQLAVAEGATVHVLTRSAGARRLATLLGAASAADPASGPPEALDAAIVFAPAGELVPAALAALDRGGVAVVAGIHLSDIPRLDYQAHLFHERDLRCVTANTRNDGRELLEVAARISLRVAPTVYPMAEADRALADLAGGRVTGVAVIDVAGGRRR